LILTWLCPLANSAAADDERIARKTRVNTGLFCGHIACSPGPREVPVRSDLRYAWRSIWKSPATTVGALLALALGIGATTTIFGLLNAVLLRPLPYPDSERLVEIWGTVQRERVERRGASFPDYFDWRAQATSYDGMAAWLSTGFIAYGAGEPELVNAEIVDGPYFELLGVRALHGRVFQDADHRANAQPVAVISERFWEQRFNRNPEVIGRALQLDSRVFTIVGVVPARFRGRSDQAAVWTPAYAAVSAGRLQARGNRSFPALARLKQGITLESAQAEMNTISAQLERQYFATNEKRAAQVTPLATEVFQNIRPAVSLLFGAVGLVLLIACANVASLLLARSESRRREMSLRRAIGAEDRQLMRLLLIESAMLVLLGGGFGWLLAQWTGNALLNLSPVQLPSFALPATDWRTLAFVSLVGVLTTVAIGLTPLATLRGDSLAQSLREGAVASRGAGRVSTLRLIVIGEVAVAVALLVGAALLGRSFAALLDFDPGFRPDNVLALRVQLPLPPTSPDAQQSPPPAAEPQGPGALVMLDSLRAIPGVRSAALTTSVPLADAGAIFYSAEGQGDVDATNRPRAFVRRVSAGHFETMGMAFVEGRDFTPAEMGAQSTAVIVSRNVARRFWPGQSAVGRRIKSGGLRDDVPWLTIVGVVDEANLRGIPRNPTGDPDIYFPFNQRARFFAALVRTDGDPASVAGAARAALQNHEPGVAVFDVQTLNTLVATQLAPARFLSWLTGAFAVVALTLAVIGIYGMLSYWVRRRTAEIGIRAALGANRTRLLSLVVGQALTMATIGVAAGAALAAGLTRFIEAQLFAVQPMDWVSFGGTAMVMLAAATVASLAPAVRALRLDPIVALRRSS
jgi:putative ABC transport system permease protein